MLISVIIPCYNSGNTLRRAVASVLSQTYKPFEIIVVDDGSNDPHTKSVLAELNDVTVIRQDNKGLPSARNFGIRCSSGTYIYLLDADDWIDSNAFEILVPIAELNPYSYVCSTITLEGDKSGRLSKVYNLFEQLFLNQLPYSLLISKDILSSFPYDEDMLLGYEDWDLNIRLGLAGIHCVLVDIGCFHYNVSSSGMLLSKSTLHHSSLWFYIQQKHRSAYNFSSLVQLYLLWRSKASEYPLFLYFILFAVHRIIPETIFSRLFSLFRFFSASSRVSS